MGEIGFLFDNDGVLMDSQEFHWESWKMLMREKNDHFMNEEQFIASFGKRNDRILREIIPGISEEQIKEITRAKEENFRKIAREKIKLLDGMETFLETLKKENIPRIIASSTPVGNLKMFLESTVLGNYFDQFVSGEEVPHGKPAPDVFLEAAKRINIPPNRCIVVEDAPVGIQAGKAAGCFVVALCTTYGKERLGEADLIYPGPRDMNLKEIRAKSGL